MDQPLTLPPDFRGRAIPLTSVHVAQTASALGVPLRHFRALLAVETRDRPYLDDGRPEILFEHGRFREFTAARFDASYPDLSNPSWGRGYGLAGAHQYTRLLRAMALDRDAALRATSWGVGQVMGFNARTLGYGSPDDMIGRFCDSGAEQLAGVVRYLEHAALVGPLRRGDWLVVATGYNGTGQAPRYAAMLAEACAAEPNAGPAGAPRLLYRGMRGTDVAALQSRLDRVGFSAGPADGVFGPATEAAVKALQITYHATPDGIVGPATLGVLTLAEGD